MSYSEIKTYSDDSSIKQTCSLCSEHTDGVGMSDKYVYKTEDVEQIKVHQPSGCWLQTKPNWFHRLMARLLLGWKWEDRK